MRKTICPFGSEHMILGTEKIHSYAELSPRFY
jgi:hypothetical protein